MVVLFGRAAIFVLLMWEPLQVASDSEEEVMSEWTLWKKHNEVSYDEKVSTDHFDAYICIYILCIKKLMKHAFFCKYRVMMIREEASGRPI